MLGSANKLKTPRTISLSGDVTGSASFDGSGNVTIQTEQSNIAVLTGTMTLEANSQESFAAGDKKQTLKQINFPTGYNKDNCVCIAFGIKRFEEKNYCYGAGGSVSIQSVIASYERAIVLGATEDSTKININVWQAMTSSTTIYYKIVLMKI